MLSPILVAVVYAVVASIVIPLMFKVFRAQYQLADVVLAAVVAGLASMIPTIGGIASLVILVAILNYRCGASLFPDIIVSVGVARLAMVPALLPFTRG